MTNYLFFSHNSNSDGGSSSSSFLLSNIQGQHTAGAGRTAEPDFIILNAPSPPLDGSVSTSRWPVSTPGNNAERTATSRTQKVH